MDEDARLGAWLDDAAARLVGTQRVPIDLAGVLRQTGLELELRPQRIEKIHGALYQSQTGSCVVVYGCSPGDKLHPRHRFTIAHEIGHHLLAQRGVPAPVDNREYWKREELCNQFAAALLVPDRAVRYAISQPWTESGNLYARLRLVSEHARVSREVVCKRIGPRIGDFSSWEIDRLPRHDVLGRVRWSVESRPVLGLYARSHVGLDHRLAEIIKASFAMRPHTVATMEHEGICWAVEHRAHSLWAVQLPAAPVTHELDLFNQDELCPSTRNELALEQATYR